MDTNANLKKEAMYDYTGYVKELTAVHAVTERFSKRTLVLTDRDERYPSIVPIEFANEKMANVEDLRPGDKVKVGFHINGREWDGKYFTNLRGMSVEILTLKPDTSFAPRDQAPPTHPQPGRDANPPSGTISDADEGDDLPF